MKWERGLGKEVETENEGTVKGSQKERGKRKKGRTCWREGKGKGGRDNSLFISEPVSYLSVVTVG